jgi:hypothetical protein
MQMRRFIFALGFLICSHLQAFKVPAVLEERIIRTCNLLVVQLGNESFSIEAVLRAIDQKFFDRPAYRATRIQFHDVVKTYVHRESGAGRQLLSIANDLELTIDQYVNPELPPERLAEILDESSRISNELKNKARGPLREFSFADLGVSFRDPELTKLVEDFGRTGMKLRFVDRWSLLKAEFAGIAYSFTTLSNWETRLKEFDESLIEFAMARLGITAQYRGFSLESKRWQTLPPGVYFTDHTSLPGLTSWIMHEMAHAVQDRFWNYHPILDFYIARVKPYLQVALGDYRSRLHSLEGAASTRFLAFEAATAHSQYRRDFLQNAMGSGLHKVDLVLLLELLHLLGEVDSHLIAGKAMDETAYPVLNWRKDRVMAHIYETYGQELGEFSEVTERLYDSEQLFALVKWLNENPRP